MRKYLQVHGSLQHSVPTLHNYSKPLALFLIQILLLLGPCNFHHPSIEVEVVVEGIAVAHTTVDMGYMGSYYEIVVPFETASQDETEAQPKTEVQPRTEAQPIQYLFAPQSSLDMNLLFSLS